MAESEMKYLVESNKAILLKLETIENKIDDLQEDMTKVKAFVSTGNEDVTKKLKKLAH